jgi:hypothetical protein
MSGYWRDRFGTVEMRAGGEESRMAEGTGLDTLITAVTVFKDGARAAERHGERGARAAAHSDRQPARNGGSRPIGGI